MKRVRGLLRRLVSVWILLWFSLRRRATTQGYRRLDRQAQRIVDESLRNNVRRRSATSSSTARFLLWGHIDLLTLGEVAHLATGSSTTHPSSVRVRLA